MCSECSNKSICHTIKKYGPKTKIKNIPPHLFFVLFLTYYTHISRSRPKLQFSHFLQSSLPALQCASNGKGFPTKNNRNYSFINCTVVAQALLHIVFAYSQNLPKEHSTFTSSFSRQKAHTPKCVTTTA